MPLLPFDMDWFSKLSVQMQEQYATSKPVPTSYLDALNISVQKESFCDMNLAKDNSLPTFCTTEKVNHNLKSIP